MTEAVFVRRHQGRLLAKCIDVALQNLLERRLELDSIDEHISLFATCCQEVRSLQDLQLKSKYGTVLCQTLHSLVMGHLYNTKGHGPTHRELAASIGRHQLFRELGAVLWDLASAAAAAPSHKPLQLPLLLLNHDVLKHRSAINVAASQVKPSSRGMLHSATASTETAAEVVSFMAYWLLSGLGMLHAWATEAFGSERSSINSRTAAAGVGEAGNPKAPDTTRGLGASASDSGGVIPASAAAFWSDLDVEVMCSSTGPKPYLRSYLAFCGRRLCSGEAAMWMDEEAQGAPESSSAKDTFMHVWRQLATATECKHAYTLYALAHTSCLLHTTADVSGREAGGMGLVEYGFCLLATCTTFAMEVPGVAAATVLLPQCMESVLAWLHLFPAQLHSLISKRARVALRQCAQQALKAIVEGADSPEHAALSEAALGPHKYRTLLACLRVAAEISHMQNRVEGNDGGNTDMSGCLPRLARALMHNSPPPGYHAPAFSPARPHPLVDCCLLFAAMVEGRWLATLPEGHARGMPGFAPLSESKPACKWGMWREVAAAGSTMATATSFCLESLTAARVEQVAVRSQQPRPPTTRLAAAAVVASSAVAATATTSGSVTGATATTATTTAATTAPAAKAAKKKKGAQQAHKQSSSPACPVSSATTTKNGKAPPPPSIPRPHLEGPAQPEQAVINYEDVAAAQYAAWALLCFCPTGGTLPLASPFPRHRHARLQAALIASHRTHWTSRRPEWEAMMAAYSHHSTHRVAGLAIIQLRHHSASGASPLLTHLNPLWSTLVASAIALRAERDKEPAASSNTARSPVAGMATPAALLPRSARLDRVQRALVQAVVAIVPATELLTIFDVGMGWVPENDWCSTGPGDVEAFSVLLSEFSFEPRLGWVAGVCEAAAAAAKPLGEEVRRGSEAACPVEVRNTPCSAPLKTLFHLASTAPAASQALQRVIQLCETHGMMRADFLPENVGNLVGILGPFWHSMRVAMCTQQMVGVPLFVPAGLHTWARLAAGDRPMDAIRSAHNWLSDELVQLLKNVDGVGNSRPVKGKAGGSRLGLAKPSRAQGSSKSATPKSGKISQEPPPGSGTSKGTGVQGGSLPLRHDIMTAYEVFALSYGLFTDQLEKVGQGVSASADLTYNKGTYSFMNLNTGSCLMRAQLTADKLHPEDSPGCARAKAWAKRPPHEILAGLARSPLLLPLQRWSAEAAHRLRGELVGRVVPAPTAPSTSRKGGASP